LSATPYRRTQEPHMEMLTCPVRLRQDLSIQTVGEETLV
jgi:hypothetical protein